MSLRLLGVEFAATDPPRLARWWADALGWVAVEEPGGVVVAAPGGAAWDEGGTPRLSFAAVPVVEPGRNRLHLDLASDSEAQQQRTVERLLALGARRLDIGQGEVPWVVLADPEGNELCVLEPRSDYVGARGIAAIVVGCREPEAVARFWSAVTGWGLEVHPPRFAWLDRRGPASARLEFLAIPTLEDARSRLRLDVASAPGQDLDEQVAWVEEHGARKRPDVREVGVAVLTDPGGQAFHLRGSGQGPVDLAVEPNQASRWSRS